MIISLCQKRNNYFKKRECRRAKRAEDLLGTSQESFYNIHVKSGKSCKIHRGRPPLRRRPPSLRQRVALVRPYLRNCGGRGKVRFCTLLHEFSHANLNFAGAPRRRRGTPPPAKSKMSLKTRWGVLTPESSHDVNVPGNPSRRASRARNMVHNVTHHNIT